jgi:hypothetical protein
MGTLLDQTILLHFRSTIDRPLNLPQYLGSNNYFSIPEENTYIINNWGLMKKTILDEVVFILFLSYKNQG